MWGRAPEQTGASPSVPTVMHSPSRVPAPPASLGPAAGARLHGAAWPEGPTAEGRCASTRALPLMYQVSRAVAAPGPGAWVARACPQSSEGFLSDSSSDSFTTTSSPSGCRRPRAQSRDSTNREMAATPALSTTAAAITPQALRFPDWTESSSPVGVAVTFLREGTLCGVTGVPVDVAVPSWRVSVPQPSSSLESGQSGWPSQSHVCGTQAPPSRQRSSPAGQGWELQL